MGSFIAVCSISRQTIQEGQKVIAVPLEEYDEAFYCPKGFPITGILEDCGVIKLADESELDVLQGDYFVCLPEAYEFIYKYAEDNKFYGLSKDLGDSEKINSMFDAVESSEGSEALKSRFIIQDYFTLFTSSVSYKLAKSMGSSREYYQENYEEFLKLLNLKHILYQFNIELIPSYWGNQDYGNDYGKHYLDLVTYVYSKLPKSEDYD